MKIFDHDINAQSTIEFTFGVIVIMFLVYGMVQVFRWSGMDLAQRRYSMDNSITTPIDPQHPLNGTDPSIQLNPDFDHTLPIAGVFRGEVSNGNVEQ